MVARWNVAGFALATTFSVAYVACFIFDRLFPPFGLLALASQASPWPLVGGFWSVAAGLILFATAGFVLGAIHALALAFWHKRLS